MFTRFETESSAHVFNAPLIKIPPSSPGAMFLGALGGAYEDEVEHPRDGLLQNAADLQVTLQQDELRTRPGVEVFLASLRAVIVFLNSIDEDVVRLHSYERTPSIDELLVAFAEGGGAADWALSELGAIGERGRKALLSVLKKEQEKSKVLAAVSMLLIVFRDDQSRTAVQKLVEKCETDMSKDASLLLAAYTST